MNIAEQHDWIESQDDFEAVLRCTNSLTAWDKNVILRAFQTFGWDDASVSGEDLAFIHAETGVMVRHDGAVLAIDFGNENLHTAFPDLFAVLHGLGWRSVEVFHPGETINALLTDIGKSIPAHMDLDVQPAKGVGKISDYAEGAMLIASGKAALKIGRMSPENQVVLEELESMNLQSGSITAEFSNGPRPIVLMDDDNADDTNERLFVEEALLSSALNRHACEQQYDDEQPQTFTIPSRAYPGNVLKNFTVPDSETEKISERVTELIIDSERLRTKIKEQPSPLDTFKNAWSKNLIKVGPSEFYFDFPGSRLSDDNLKLFMSRYQATNVVHLRPGTVGETVRWDMFGEFTPQYPWFAEKIVSAMNLGITDYSLIASVIFGLKANRPGAQLRDLLSMCTSSTEDVLKSLSGISKSLLIHSDEAKLTQILDAVIQRLHALVLCPDGDAFVDVRQAHDSATSIVFESFTIRAALQSPEARLFFVHVDGCDGPFVSLIVELMQNVAISYASTNRVDMKVAA